MDRFFLEARNAMDEFLKAIPVGENQHVTKGGVDEEQKKVQLEDNNWITEGLKELEKAFDHFMIKRRIRLMLRI